MASKDFTVAVRVRPFGIRDMDRGAKHAVVVDGNNITVVDLEDTERKSEYTFPHVFWSVSGFKESEDGTLEALPGSNYASQQKVYEESCTPLLDSMLSGIDSSIIMYGPTGAGKSYTMFGYGPNKGIASLLLANLFSKLDERRKEEEIGFQASIGSFEIYNEHLRDLLAPKSKTTLKIRQQRDGKVYVDGLTMRGVENMAEVDLALDDLNRNKTIAATLMNSTSSRSHTLIQFSLVQKIKGITRKSVLTLADLAGSEKVSQTGASGDRLREGASINKSLSSLGTVIYALSTKKDNRKTIVPYRDSRVTHVLKNSLGGTAKTLFFVAISCSHYQYEGTERALRLAKRACEIENKTVVNEVASDKLISELKQEIEKLKSLSEKTPVDTTISGEDKEDSEGKERQQLAKAQLDKVEAELKQIVEQEEELAIPWWRRKKKNDAELFAEKQRQFEEDKRTFPHLWSLNEDNALSGSIVHFIKSGKCLVGNMEAQPLPEIQLAGMSIAKKHCEIIDRDGELFIKSLEKSIMVNGKTITSETKLTHNDRIVFGPNNFFILKHPKEQAKLHQAGTKVEKPNYENAMREIVLNSNLITGKINNLQEDLDLQDILTELLTQVMEATGMAEALDKGVRFEIAVLSSQSKGGQNKNKYEVMVKVIATDGTGNEWLWEREKFVFRNIIMLEMYHAFAEGNKDWNVPQYKDPFWDPPDSDKLIGTASFSLLMFLCSGERDTADIIDYEGVTRGQLEVMFLQCSPDLQPLEEDMQRSDPDDFLGMPFHGKILILSAKGLPRNIDASFCRYKFFTDNNFTETQQVGGSNNPIYSHEKVISLPMTTMEFTNYMKNETLSIQIFGKQRPGGMKEGPDAAGVVFDPQLELLPPKLTRQSTKFTELPVETPVHNDPAPVQQTSLESHRQTQDEETATRADGHAHTAVKTKDEENQKRKEAMEADQSLRTKIYDYLRQRKAEGHTAIRIEDIVALLEGLEPPGRPVDVAADSSSHGQDGNTSKACTLQ